MIFVPSHKEKLKLKIFKVKIFSPSLFSAAVKIDFMSEICRLYVGNMSTLCRKYVDFMSETCRLFVGHMSTLCRKHVAFLSEACRLYVGNMSILFWPSLNLDKNYVSRITELVMNLEFKLVKNSSFHLSFGQVCAVYCI